MADTPAAPGRPAAARPRNLIIVGVAAAIIGGIYLWRKNKTAAASNAAAAQDTTATAPVVAGGAGNGYLGIPTSALFAILQNHMQGPAGPTGATGAAGSPGAPGNVTLVTPPITSTPTAPTGQMVTVPVTYGKRANAAIAQLTAAGFQVSTSPARNPAKTYVSIGSSPEGGRQAPRGSHVTLNVRQG